MSRALVALLIFGACASARPRPSLVSTGEASKFTATGRYDEAIRLCHAFARAYREASCETIGQTGEGRPILALMIRRHAKLPVVFVQAGIHAGEIEGKDAGFAFFRDLLDGKVAPGALDRVAVAFVPVVNPDGHERFSPNNRPNQRGPVEMGFRTNAARLNINRDYVKVDAPETAAMLRVWREQDPALFVDLHTTDGAKFEQDISINAAPVAPRRDHLERDAQQLGDAIVARLTALGNLPVGFYPSFVAEEDPASGFAIGEAPPRFSQFYAAARGRLGILVETHSWRTYKERATSTYRALQAIFERAVTDAPQWVAREAAASADAAQLGGTDVALVFENGPHATQIAFRGYAYEQRASELSGGTWIVYDETKPQLWNVPLRDELVPKVTVRAPNAEYIVDGGFAPIVEPILRAHGIAYAREERDTTAAVEVYRVEKATFAPTFEGRTRATLPGAWKPETRAIDRGALRIPIAQPLARLVLHLFEPALPDSLAQWGFFNACLERKEYMEPYVAEAVARELLAKDPALRAQLDAAIAADPELAKSPARRLDWFYQRSAAWDERVNLLPVYRR